MRKLLVLLLLAPCALLAQVPDYVPTDGLLTWHDLDGDAVDQIGNHTGQLIGPTSTQNRYGEEGKALMFSDGDYVELGTYTEIQDLCEFSTSIWYYGAENQGSGCCNMLWCSGFDQWLLNLGTWNHELVFGGGLNCGAQGASASDVNLYENWNHVVTVLKAGKASVWLNGHLKVEVNMSNCVCSHSNSMRLGTMDGYPHHFTGMMDDFGVWNRGLSETEISTLFIGTPPINGCTDPNSCNFDAEANLDDGSCYSCDIPAAHCGPGTHWDSTLAACVADVPGAEVAENCALMSLQELSQGYLNLLETVSLQDSLLNACQGDTASSGGSTDPATDPTAWSCSDPLPYQGYDYATVQIGDQCWFAEHLRAESYRNGDAIPSNLSDSQWVQTNAGATAIMGEGPSDCTSYTSTFDACDESLALPNYGRLYNFHAVTDSRNLCPEGWSVPSDEAFQTLESSLGISAAELGQTGWRGTNQGDQLKSTEGWYQFGNGSNALGFNAEPGGRRYRYIGYYQSAGATCFLWSTTSTGGVTAMGRELGWDSDQINREPGYHKNNGNSVRCLKD